MKLIVGLGNPGDKYNGNRHNIGFMAVDELARGYRFGPWKKRFQGFTSEGQIGAVKCILLKPSTYMNESGRAVGEAMRFYKFAIGDVIAIHDELDLKPGAIRVKTGGGNAGHNGLKSMSAYIGNEYVRVRLGIGHPGDKALVANYVLQDFAKADRQWLDPLLEGVARGMQRLVEGGEAAFLSEATRGRNPTPAAAKLNGQSAPAAKMVEAASSMAGTKAPAAKAEASVAGTKGAGETVLVASIPVVASREGSGGGAVSRAVILPEPERAPSAQQQASNLGPATISPRTAHAQNAAVQKDRSGAAMHAAAAIERITPAAKKSGFFSRLFRSRSRGDITG